MNMIKIVQRLRRASIVGYTNTERSYSRAWETRTDKSSLVPYAVRNSLVSKLVRYAHVNEFSEVNQLQVVRWGIAPVSLMADDFATALGVLSQVHHKITACAASYRSHAEEFAKRHKVQNCYTSFEELAEAPNVDVIYISPLNPLHFELCQIMLQAGKHVLCEKPLCTTEDQVHILVNLARVKNRFLMEGMWSRCVPAYFYLRRQITRNALGDVRQITCTLGMPTTDSKLSLYGGVTYDYGIYGIQLALWVFRRLPVAIKTNGKLNEDGVDIGAVIELIFDDNKRATIKVSAEEALSNQAIITGTKGHITMNNYWCPTVIEQTEQDIRGRFLFPLPPTNLGTHFHNRIGMCYEAEEVRSCLMKGKTQSELFNHNESLLIANIIDTVRKQLGVETIPKLRTFGI